MKQVTLTFYIDKMELSVPVCVLDRMFEYPKGYVAGDDVLTMIRIPCIRGKIDNDLITLLESKIGQVERDGHYEDNLSMDWHTVSDGAMGSYPAFRFDLYSKLVKV